MPQTELLPPSAAARAKQLAFFARTRVEGFLKSQNRSRLKGTSTEFLHHRMYMPGDELRSIDWRVFARTDRLVTREYEEFTNLDAVLALDCSGSMSYGSDIMTKLDFARRCAAMMGYLFDLQRDRYGLALFSNHVACFLPPSSGRKHMAEFFRRLVDTPPEGETDVAACVARLLPQFRRRSAFLFFSDGYQDPESLARSLGMLRFQGHDVLLFQVYDPSETDLQFVGFTQFRDLETNLVDAADPLEIRRAYREVFQTHQERLRNGLARFGIDFHALPVQANWDQALANLLHKREG